MGAFHVVASGREATVASYPQSWASQRPLFETLEKGFCQQRWLSLEKYEFKFSVDAHGCEAFQFIVAGLSFGGAAPHRLDNAHQYYPLLQVPAYTLLFKADYVRPSPALQRSVRQPFDAFSHGLTPQAVTFLDTRRGRRQRQRGPDPYPPYSGHTQRFHP